MSTVRILVSYDTFRAGFSDPEKAPPEWNDLAPYVRDAITIAYHQGHMDGVGRERAAYDRAKADAYAKHQPGDV